MLRWARRLDPYASLAACLARAFQQNNYSWTCRHASTVDTDPFWAVWLVDPVHVRLAAHVSGQIHRARRSRCFFYFSFLFFSLIPHCLGRAFPHGSLLYLHIYPFQKKYLHIYILTGSYTMWFIHPYISSASIFS
jgi:hypothetical protein